jgi:DNA polymerase III delta prime subunit
MAWVHKYKFNSNIDLDNIRRLIPTVSHIHNLIINGFCNTYMEYIINSFLKETIEHVGEWNNVIFNINNEKKQEISICIRQSTLHTEIDVNDIGTNHRQFIHNILKKIIQNMSLNKNTELTHKFIILYNIHNLSKNAQVSLKSLIEYNQCCTKFILISNSIGAISHMLLSHFSIYKFRNPFTDEVLIYMKSILQQEKKYVEESVILNIMNEHLPDVEKCVHKMQHKACGIDDDITICLNEICLSIIKGKYNKIRDNTYILIVNNITCSVIIKEITDKLLSTPNIPTKIKYKIIESAAKFEHRLHHSEREIYHVEGFTSYCVMLTENIKT